MKNSLTLKLLKIALICLNINISFSNTSPYELKNGSFEHLSSGNINNINAHFTARRLGASWYAYKGNPQTHHNSYNNIYTCGPCGNGSRFASLTYNNTNGLKKGNSFFAYYPMKAGNTYKLKFDYKKNNNGVLYIIATNSATANYDINSNYLENIGNITNNRLNTLPLNDQMLITKVTQNTTNWSNNSSTGNNISPNITYTPNKDYTQLLFVYYSSDYSSNGDKHMYIDGVKLTGALNEPGRVKMALNGSDADTNAGIQVCSGDPVFLDGRGTIDTSLEHNNRVQYFIGIYRFGSTGNFEAGNETWNDGIPYNNLDIQSLFPLTSPYGVTTEYRVKLAINSGPNNTWIEKVMKVYVIGKANFTINKTHVFTSTYNKVKLQLQGLPQNVTYTYKWYKTGSTLVLGTSNTFDVYSSGSYTIEVTDANTGCTTKKIITINVPTHLNDDSHVSQLSLSGKTAEVNKDNLDLIIYPNPTSDKIQLKTTLKIDKLSLYSLNGIHLTTSYTSEMNVKSLNKGVYLLKIFSNQKLIKESKIIKK